MILILVTEEKRHQKNLLWRTSGFSSNSASVTKLKFFGEAREWAAPRQASSLVAVLT